ncbi:MAG: WD40 repeat domain-containing protein [Candidatus Poribacteria bacterium]|nr:WD40 repeat domain-containing protein [Candidatus Poribacteria bacterium]
MSDNLSKVFAVNYPRENTVCLPPGAVARFERGGISDVAVSSDENLIAVASSLGVWLYDAHTKDFVSLIAVEGTGLLSKVVFSPDGTRIAAGDWDGKTTLWDINTGTALATYTHKDYINSIAFSPNGKFIATGSRDATTTLWDVESEEQLWCITHEKQIDAVAFSPDSIFMATYYLDSTFVVLRVADGIPGPGTIHHEKWIDKNKGTPPVDHHEEWSGRRVQFSPNGKHLAGLREAVNSLTLWDVNTGENIKTLKGSEGRGRSLVFSSEGHCFGLGCTAYPEYDTIELWDEEKRASFTHSGLVDTVTMSPDGMCLATGGRDKTVKLWHVETQQCLQTLSGHIGRILSLAFSPDGTLLVSGGGDNWEMQKHADGRTTFFSSGDSPVDKTAKVWEVATGANIDTLESSGMVRGIAFSPDGKHLATGANNKTVTLWCAKTWQPITTLDTVSFESFAFSPDGSQLVIGGTWPEQRIQVWDVETRELIVELSGHKSDVESFAFSPDSRLLASGGFDGIIYLSDMTPYLKV